MEIGAYIYTADLRPKVRSALIARFDRGLTNEVKMPDAAAWESRRSLTDNPATSPETFRRVGRKLLELGQLAEALEFMGRAGDEEGLRLIMERAVAEGHFFLFQAAAAKLGVFQRADLEKLAAAAEKNGQALYAAQARALLDEPGGSDG